MDTVDIPTGEVAIIVLKGDYLSVYQFVSLPVREGHLKAGRYTLAGYCQLGHRRDINDVLFTHLGVLLVVGSPADEPVEEPR